MERDDHGHSGDAAAENLPDSQPEDKLDCLQEEDDAEVAVPIPPPPLRTATSVVAAMELAERVRKGQTVRIPSLNITLTKEHLADSERAEKPKP